MEKKEQYTNRLIHADSPYLLQHAYNPVDWFPWSDEAFEKAEKENKLLLVSIGYSSCHWCHVMEEESFSDSDVAKIMNDHFVCIKVDREERPDVDNIYMDAVQLITGRGGWPLNCFVLPDGKPVFGGTYFPRDQWIQILTKLSETYRREPNILQQQAEEITQGVSQLQYLPHSIDGEDIFSVDELKKQFGRIEKRLDIENGGLKGAPKFPMPVIHEALLKYNFYFREESLNKYLNTTLKRMARGGIFDHLGGGFARYSTDNEWMVPHFEKMLYDNAQLVSLYSQAYRITKDEEYAQVVHETLRFLQREFLTEQDVFFSALDADTEGEEGRFYTWTKQDFESLFITNSDIIAEYFGVTKEGNFEGRNVLQKSKSEKELAKKYGLPESKIHEILTDAKKELFKKRSKRKQPDLDNKVITSWNALAVKAFLDGYRATKKKDYLRIALNCAEFLVTNQLQNDYRLNRIFANGNASVNGFLDDYAFLIDALIELYQITFDEKWIDWAYKLTDYVQKHFRSSNSPLFNYKSDLDKPLISPKTEIMDTVLPSSNAVMAKNLFILGQYFYMNSYIDQSRNMLKYLEATIQKNPTFFAKWLDLFMWFVLPPYEIAIVGKKAEAYKERFTFIYHPGIILAGGMHEGNLPILSKRFKLGQTKIYICQEQVCQEPLSNVEEALKKIS